MIKRKKDKHEQSGQFSENSSTDLRESSVNKVDLPSVFQFRDHREFLRTYFEWLRSNDPGFSLRRLAQAAGLATGYLPMFLSQKRRLSRSALEKLILHLKLNSNEKSFLVYLWGLSESETHEGRMFALKKIQKFGTFRKESPLELEAYKYLSKWYNLAIRELVRTVDFKEDPIWIQNKLSGRITLKEIKESLQFLLEHHLIERLPDGKLQVTEKIVRCTEGIYKLSLGDFHRQTLELAAKAIDQVPREKRLIMGHTFAVAPDELPQVWRIIETAISQIERLGKDSKNPQDVYHIELGAFPLTNSNPETEKKE